MIIFDFDGVISDSLAVCRGACQRAAKQQNSPLILETNPFRHLNPLTFEALAAELGLNASRFAQDVAHYMHDQANHIPFFGGIKTAVATLSRQYRLFIVSASHSETIRIQLQRHGMTEHFEAILGGNIPGSKTDKIAELQRTWQLRAIVVGDSASDIMAARACGALSIAVSWGWQSQYCLQAQQPTTLIHAPGDLPFTVSSMAG